MKLCTFPDCDRPHTAKGLCKPHYSKLERGTLDRPPDAPRYRAPRRSVGRPLQWPFEVRKIDGVWHRRPTDSGERWVPVVWGVA